METIATPPEESSTERRDRHEAHQSKMEEQKLNQVNRRELHKRTHGKKWRYPGFLY